VSAALRTGVRTYLLDGFDDPRCGPERWNALVAAGELDSVFQTWQFQQAWWETYKPGKLLFVAAERGGEVVALAPFYSDRWGISFVGAEEAEWLDFLGDVRDDAVVEALVEEARSAVPQSVTFDLAPIPGWTPRLRQLEAAAAAHGLQTWQVVDELTPVLDITSRPDVAEAATSGSSTLKQERWFRRSGEFTVEHLQDGEEILPHLDGFFEQHVARWEETDQESPFLYSEARVFLERLTRLMSKTGWLRFTRVLWEGRPIAHQFSFCYRGRFTAWRTSFAIDLARRSPGRLVDRHQMLAAIEEGAHTWDWGLGPLPYKLRFATSVETACWWGTKSP